MDHKIRNRKQSYTTYDIYNNYDKRDQIPYSTFRGIVDKLNDSILSVLQNGQNYKLPCSLGTVQIVKYKPKEYNKHSLSIDFNESKKLDKRIYHLNEHSNGLLRKDGPPKEMDFNQVNQDFISSVASKRNHIPRKSLNYQTPLEVFLSYVNEEQLSRLI